MKRRPPRSTRAYTLCPYPTLFRSGAGAPAQAAVAPSAGQTHAYTVVPHTSMRRTIARRLSESKQTVPHFYLRADCRMDALLAMRKQINQSGARKVSVNDIIVKAVAAALRQLQIGRAHV